ncbi:MAG: hypothetical protein V3W41_08255 [Planctomycetota bacterium]
MTRLFGKLFGFELGDGSSDATWRVDWTGAPDGGDGVLLVMVLVGLIGWGVWWLYRRDGVALTRRQRWGLTALRTTAIVLVLMMFLEPVLVSERETQKPSKLLILRDVSASMDIEDGLEDPESARAIAAALGLTKPEAIGDKSRQDLVDIALSGGLERALERDGDRQVQVHEFADRFFLEPETDPELSRAARDYTAIGSSLEQALAAYHGQGLAGILLISDGQSNAGPLPARSAELAAALGVPVHVLGVGGSKEARNAAITKVDSNEVTFVKDKIQIKVYVDARGMPSESATVALERSVDGGAWEPLQNQEIIFDEAGKLSELSFESSLDRPGEIHFRARLEDLGPEITTEDNSASSKTRVVKRKMRVLLVAGLAFPEVQFLINTLMRDQSIEVSSWLMFAESAYKQKGNKIITRLPQSEDELDEYDCVVLYDTDLRQMPANFGRMLNEFVGKSGGGLVFIAGESSTADLFDRKHSGSDEITAILPVVREPGVFQTRIEMRLSAQSEWKLELTRAGARDSLFRFDDDPERSREIMRALPGMYWYFPVTREKPGATVLARHGDARMSNQYGRHVVIATQLYGPGRTYFLGLDSTFRWRFLREAHYDQFWARLVNDAGLAKRLGGRQPFTVATDRASYAPGSVVTLQATFRDIDDLDVGRTTIVGEIESGDEGGESLLFSAVPGVPGRFEAQYQVRTSGPHFVRAWASEAPQDGAKPVTYEFRVEFPNRELAAPSQDRTQLAAIAAATQGRVFNLAEIDEIPDAFAIGKISRRQQERQELWDAPILFALALLLIFIEWFLRKRYRLV